MAAVMYKAAHVEDTTANENAEKIAQLEYENKHLRELLQFSTPRLLDGEESVFLSSDTSPSATTSEKHSDNIMR